MNPNECNCKEPVPDYMFPDVCIKCGKEIVTEYMKKLRSLGWNGNNGEHWERGDKK